MTALREVADGSESEWMRLDAAKALAKLALDVVTKTRSGAPAGGGKGGGDGQKDLFDAAAELGPWKLTVVK